MTVGHLESKRFTLLQNTAKETKMKNIKFNLPEKAFLVALLKNKLDNKQLKENGFSSVALDMKTVDTLIKNYKDKQVWII